MISKNKLFIFFSISFIVGVFTNNITSDFTTSFIVLLFLIVLFFAFYIFLKKFFVFILFIILGFLLGILISQNNINKINYKQSYINKYIDNNSYEVIFEIKKIYEYGEYNTSYLGEIKEINSNKVNKKIYGLFYITKNYNYGIGNIVQSKSKIYGFENFDNFNYQKYMLSKNIFLKSYIYSPEIISNKKLNFINNNIQKIRNFFIDSINKIYTENEGIFLAGILIGARENIPENLETNFNNSGLTHLIAVSGFNITILIILLSYLLKIFPNFVKFCLISIFIVFFTILVGDGASVIRASIMGIIGYYILLSGRKGDSLAIICFTAILMILYSPFSLNFDISMHLSFLAVIGIVYTQKFFSKIFYFLPNILEIKDSVILTFGALSFTLPIIFFNFGQLSILSPIANILVGWTIPLSMLFGFISILVYYISNTFGIFIGFFAWILLKWDILIVNLFGQQNWALIKYNFGIYDNILQILYFCILIFCLIYFRKKEE